MEPALSVGDVLTKSYVGVSESDTVLEVARLMREERAGCVLVVRGEDPVGILTEWDVLGLVAKEGDPAETTVESVMSTPVVTVEPSLSLSEAATRMAVERIRHLVVTDGTALVGVLTQRDVIAAAGSFSATTATDEDLETRRLASEGGSDLDAEPLANGGDAFSRQGVCESCGSLADTLWEVNGQLVCSDCRTV